MVDGRSPAPDRSPAPAPEPDSTPPCDGADHAEFIALFLQSEREVFRYVASFVPDPNDAREIVQAAAVELWRTFERYDRSRPFTPWACRFALRQVQAHVRRRQRWRVMLDGGVLEQLAAEREAMAPERERRLAHLDRCLARLPSTQAELVRLYYLEGKPLPEISERLGRTVEALYKALQRTRATLLECMRRAESEGGEMGVTA